MESYDSLLKQAYDKVKVVSKSTERFEIPKVSGQVEGKNTIITNITQIAGYLRRDINQLSKFLLKELAVSGKIDKDRLILNSKFNSIKINEKIEQYSKEFVVCKECGKPDTEIISDKHLKFKHCLACGAKSPIRSI
ncbi:MAG: translation initiation factor IF-2 subunit beta [archaeon]